MDKNENLLESIIDFAWASGANLCFVQNAKDELKQLVDKNKAMAMEAFKANKFAIEETNRWLSCEKELAQLKENIGCSVAWANTNDRGDAENFMSNTLCNGRIKNNNSKSPIEYFLLVTIREFSDYKGGSYVGEIKNVEHFPDSEETGFDEPYYQVYGERYSHDPEYKSIFLGEFYSLDKAKDFLYNLTGETLQIITSD